MLRNTVDIFRFRRRPIWLALVLLVWAQVPVQAAETPQIPHEVYVLPSGLQVVLVPDRSVPLVAVDVWYHVGSGDEVVGKSGFAHLFEHMMFQGAKHIGEDVHFDTLKKAGASQINGTTNTDRTNYFEQLPSHHLETALRLESDRMGWLLDTLNQKSLDNQREVVRNERRQRYDNVPYGRERFALSKLLYPEGHPYRHLTIGLHEDLERASVGDVQAFFRKWYAPSNATICLAGDFAPAEAKAALAKWFGTFPKVARPQRVVIAAPEIKAPVTETVEDPLARLERIHYAWHSAASYKPGDAELDIAAYVLGHPGTGRLYQRLVQEEQWAQSVQVYQASAQMSSTFHVVVDCKPGAPRDKVLAVIAEELHKLRSAPVTDKERDRAVLDVESGFIWGLEGLMNRCEVLQGYQHYLGKTAAIAEDLQRYRGAAPKTIQAVVSTTLDPAKSVLVITQPKAGGVP